jgi:hypothetical protein
LIDQQFLQIAGRGKTDFDPRNSSPGKVFLCQYTGNSTTGGYNVVWESIVINNMGHNVRIGDIDNDTQKEIVALHTNVEVVGKGKNEQRFYSHEVLIFEDGALAEPTSRLSLEGLEAVGGPADGIWIADVDNDSRQDLIVMRSGTSSGIFEVYNIIQTDPSSHVVTRLYCQTSEIYSGGGIWSLEVGDVDNDTKNEILLSRFNTTRPFILEFTGSGWAPVPESDIEPTGSEEAFNGGVTLNFNVIKVRDVDGDGLNELIAGGNSGWLMIWKYTGGYYFKTFSAAVDTRYFTWAMDAADIDGDNIKEIVIGLGAGNSIPDAIRVYKYSEGTYQALALDPQEIGPSIGLDQIQLGDLDRDGIAEILTVEYGLTVYHFDFSLGKLVKTYNYAIGRNFDIQ